MAKFCAHCGTSLNDDAKFCPNCGSTCEAQGAAEQAAPQMNATQMNNNAAPAMGAPVVGGKSKMVAGLLGIFLGSWGIHNFYLGKGGRGALQIVLTIVTCGLAGLWGFIEGILILCGNINTDGNGNPLVD